MKIRTGIIGASGYTGAELLRLLHGHPNLELEVATAESQAGNAIAQLYPHLQCYGAEKFVRTADALDALGACDLVFCGLPHGEAAHILPGMTNKLIVDLGSDFRLEIPSDYDAWYGRGHPKPQVLSEWTYGLPELFREQIQSSNRIANPGCYATAVLLATAPLAANDCIAGPIAVDAASGTSGAGRAPKPGLHFAHADEDIRAYKIGSHQHTPEIEMALQKCSGSEQRVSMTAHLAPMTRGIHATCSAALSKAVTAKELQVMFEAAYEGASFVHLTAEPPGTKEVRGSNYAHVHVVPDTRNKRVVAICVIDNLVKGASGQAVQNANLALGLEESTGLEAVGVYP